MRSLHLREVMFDRHVGSLRINSLGEVGMILDVHVHLVSTQFADKVRNPRRCTAPTAQPARVLKGEGEVGTARMRRTFPRAIPLSHLRAILCAGWNGALSRESSKETASRCCCAEIVWSPVRSSGCAYAHCRTAWRRMRHFSLHHPALKMRQRSARRSLLKHPMNQQARN